MTPITVLCGFLGAGKTTLLNQILGQTEKKIAVIVNEFGAVNIDAGLVVKTDEKTIELSNGCICCTLRGDLLEAVHDILNTRDVEHIVIESTGIAEPLPIAQAFCLTPEELELEPNIPNLVGKVYIDAMITVADSAQFFDMYNKDGTIEGDDLERGYGQLLQEQIEFANIVILNKTDIANPEDITKLKELVGLTNPSAHIIESQFGKVNLKDILDVKLFDFETMSQLDGWILELGKEHTPESETYGLGTYVYYSTEPFDYEKLCSTLELGLPKNIIRSKGWVHVDSSNTALLWNHTGRLLQLEPMGEWAADAFSELVFIGQDLDEELIESLLESAKA